MKILLLSFALLGLSASAAGAAIPEELLDIPEVYDPFPGSEEESEDFQTRAQEFLDNAADFVVDPDGLTLSQQAGVGVGLCSDEVHIEDDFNLPIGPMQYDFKRYMLRSDDLSVVLDPEGNRSASDDFNSFESPRFEPAYSTTGRWRILDCIGSEPKVYPDGERVIISELVMQGWRQLEVAAPTVQLLPAGDPVVRLPTYFAIEERWWKPRSIRVEQGRVWIKATFTPVATSWDLGEVGSAPMSCQGRGAFSVEFIEKNPDLCQHRYEKANEAGYEGSVTSYFDVVVETNAPYDFRSFPQLEVTGSFAIKVRELAARNAAE